MCGEPTCEGRRRGHVAETARQSVWTAVGKPSHCESFVLRAGEAVDVVRIEATGEATTNRRVQTSKTTTTGQRAHASGAQPPSVRCCAATAVVKPSHCESCVFVDVVEIKATGETHAGAVFGRQ